MNCLCLEGGYFDVSPYLIKLQKVSVECVKVVVWSREGPFNTSHKWSSLVTPQLLLSRLGMVHLGRGEVSRPPDLIPHQISSFFVFFILFIKRYAECYFL